MLGWGPRPGVEHSRTPGTADRRTAVRVAADSPRNPVNTVARSRGLAFSLGLLTWGSAALHPRLYAVARYRGLGLGTHCRNFSQVNLDFLYKAAFERASQPLERE